MERTRLRPERGLTEALLTLPEAVRATGNAILEVVMEMNIMVPQEWVDEVVLELCGRQEIIGVRLRGKGHRIGWDGFRLCRLEHAAVRLQDLSRGIGGVPRVYHDI